MRASLDRLQLEYVDIVFANKSDSLTPTEGKTDPFTGVTVPAGRIFRVEGKKTLNLEFDVVTFWGIGLNEYYVLEPQSSFPSVNID